jgi:OMF family outer membrane factor
VALNGGYDYARPNPRFFPRSGDWQDSWDVSVNASWALWDGGRTKADQAEASANVRAAESRVADFDRQVTFEVRQRALELQSSLASITASVDGVRAAAEARRVVGERYNAGVATNTEVLDAQTALLQAELDRTRAVAGARLAEARLARAVGK